MSLQTLLIHQAFVSKSEPGGTRHYELGKRLVEQGQQLTVIASDVSYQTGRCLLKRPRLISESYIDGIRLLRAYTYSGIHRSYFSRVISFLSFMVTSILAGANADSPDLVMGTTPPIFQALSACVIAKLRGSPFLLEVRDLWPEFAIDIGLLRNRTLIRLSRLLEKFLYNQADHLLVNSPAYRDYLVGKGVAPDKISFISNGVDPTMFDPGCRGEAFRLRHNLEDKFVVTYAGAIGMANDIDTLVRAAEHLKQREDIHLLIVGDGKERSRLETVAGRLGLANLTFAGSFPKEEMSNILAASDACIAILQNIPMFATTYPNKVFDYMAAGRPTILAIDGVIRAVVEAARGGIFVPPGNPKRLAEAITEMADHPQQAKAMGLSARAYVAEHFNRDEHARELVELISRVALCASA